MSQSTAFLKLIESRHSIRAFLPEAVPRQTIEQILATAARAPSGTNTQPWHVHVMTGTRRDQLVRAVCDAYDHTAADHEYEYDYYPTEFFEPYLSRRRTVGFALYGLLGIAKGDRAAMQAQHRRNYEFFGAPVGLMFSIDRRLGKGSWLDYGGFLQNVMLAARACGYDTCPQAAWVQFHRVVSTQLALPNNEQLVCGMALGRADPAAPANRLVSERVTLAEFVQFHE
ncbi:MAG: nitroreductase [Gammaproteobacteria bacterium]|nr:nitroreductase [Rhodocyclaceae bacterium]MBU3910018.1 nitroreductase [Gammaproteobacteria bacterium]MBU3989900.1 nitroreductase [Gammaproteobacteria bacterium]MBU4003991.1 nitroreductase [Gammaproteobacteria bacterium]MBU4020238.1 nitroreductase [Gammaproteobacteria bacterium]